LADGKPRVFVAGLSVARTAFKFGVADGFHFVVIIAEVVNQKMGLDSLR
jgi:hypothetical protein